MNAAALAELAGVSVRYHRDGRLSHGLIEIDLRLAANTTVAVVGESGCGKSTLGRVLLHLQHPSEGAVRFRGEDLTLLKAAELRRRRKAMQMIFQDPFASLNARMTIGETLAEPLVVHGLARWRDATPRVAAMLERVGLDPAMAARYPHEFSGGQRQRIAIARAVIAGPALVVADEPLSALDMTVQGQIVSLLISLQEAMSLTYLFISHDLPLVREFASHVVVMIGGRIVEDGPPDAVFAAPAHPYTQLLVSCVPVPDPATERARQVAATVTATATATASATRPAAPNRAPDATACPFRDRCPHAMAICATMPPFRRIAPDRHAACWLYERS
ncbi:ABC transporter ATP-binding protein [Lichenicola cladoniae]|uniref:ABC transporter ATP-binding protein n=1 Tax=Lichenicola cladoniae TaxID=1484109 RepID=A0A6M8HLK5_9PROT|nr:oligopeptide/dipeptide ABC transporter ATP-binding protein [Lichenicola cladoniae]QKE89234.1 ABC transporter ATP-binding protein [Lichenicola cladoniae]